MTKGSAKAGRATTKVRAISAPLARLTWLRSSLRYRHHTRADSVMASTMPGKRPPVNNAEIETPVTEPIVIRTRLGGMVSVCAPVEASRATRSPGLAPRCFISGNSTGATAAMSAAFEPDMPDTRYMAPTST